MVLQQKKMYFYQLFEIMSHTLVKSVFFFLAFLSSLAGSAQAINIYNPYITNFTKTNYKGGTENWDAAIAKEGYVYFANNEGLLKYDGHKWMLYQLPNKTIVRSIAWDPELNRIYVGGQDEVGYFYPDANGTLTYKSLKHLLPNDVKSLEDVWEIQLAGKKVIFRSVNKIFEYDQKSIKVLTLSSTLFNFVQYLDGKIFCGDPSKGLYEVNYGQSKFVTGSEIFVGQKLETILKLRKDRYLFVTERNGIYEYNGRVFKSFVSSINLDSKILSSALVIDPNLIAVGSVLQGIMFFDTLGVLQHNITKKQGLQTNAIISLVKDYNGSLWAGTTNGIDQILMNSAYSLIYPDGDLEGGVYAIKIYKNRLYAGTNNGLYYTKWLPNQKYRSTDFKKIANSDGQVWALDIIGDDLMMGHNQGAFQIINDRAIKISKDYIGTWRFIPVSDKNVMITGTYQGLQLCTKIGANWKFMQNIEGFNESARIIAKDKNDDIWVSHPYRGVYKLTISHNYKSVIKAKNYDKRNGLPANLTNYVVRIKNDIYVNSETGIHRYFPDSDKFLEEKELTELIGDKTNVRRFFQDNDDAIWYVNDKECGVLLTDDAIISKNVKKKSAPFVNGKLIGGFENIYAPDRSTVFVCTDKGVILIDFDKLILEQKIQIRFTEVLAGNTDRQLLFGGHTKIADQKPELDYLQNSIKFSFSTNQLDKTNDVRYSYSLNNDKWSAWSDINLKEFNNLEPGKYLFSVKALAAYGVETSPLTYEFRINNPWYSSKLALATYLSIFLMGLYSLIKYMNRKHDFEKVILIQEKELSEEKLEILQNEKLQAEIDFKNRELAFSTMHVLKKNETLTRLRDELDQVVKQSREAETKTNIKKVISILSDDKRLDDDWGSFAVHFDQAHSDFIKRLKAEYKQLSPKDLKLCAYLRMNLSSKDIAPLLNISVRGVEISRYRLRKKMNIDQESNLNDFMMNY